MQISFESETLSLEIPREIVLHVTPEKFEALAVANRDLKLERTDVKNKVIARLLFRSNVLLDGRN